MKVPRLLLLLSFLMAGAQSLFYYQQLPKLLASDFSLSGAANGWLSRSAFFTLYWIAIAAILLSCFLAPKLIKWLPSSFVRAANKRYWLAEERRDGTISYIGNQLLWLAVITFLLLIWVVQLAITSNLSANQRGSWTMMGLSVLTYLVSTLAWGFRFVGRFAQAPKAGPEALG